MPTSGADELDELLDFLVDKRPQVKLTALDILTSLTGSPDGVERLKAKTNKLVVFLLRLVCDADRAVSAKCLTALVNLSQDDALAAAMRDQNTISRAMDYLRDQSCPNPRLLVMLLNNLTLSEQGSSELLQLGKDKLEGLNMAILLKRFVMSGLTYEPGAEDVYEHVAHILTNVTRFRKARELLLQPGRGMLQALASQLRAPAELRRRGVAGAIRNCCMSAEVDGTLDHVLADAAVLTAMLGPVNGADPKEVDAHVRACLAESIMVLAATPQGREALRAVQGPEQLQKGYEYEEDPEVCKALEVAYLYFMATPEDEQAASVATAASAPGEGGDDAQCSSAAT